MGTLVHVRYKQPRIRGTHAQAKRCTSVRTHVKVQKVHQYTCKLKHPHTLTRCTFLVILAEHCTSTSTFTYTRCVAQAVHAEHCTSRSTVCTYKHKHSCILRTPPRLSMPNTVHVYVQCTRPSRRAYAQSVHHSNCSCRTLYMHTYRLHATREHSRATGAHPPPNSVHVHVRCPHDNDRCTAQIAHAEYCASTRTCTSVRQAHHSVRKCRTPYTHAYTYSRR